MGKLWYEIEGALEVDGNLNISYQAFYDHEDDRVSSMGDVLSVPLGTSRASILSTIEDRVTVFKNSLKFYDREHTISNIQREYDEDTDEWKAKVES